MQLTPEEVTGLQEKVQTGDEAAKQILTELGHPSAPDTKPTDTQAQDGAEAAKPEETAQAEAPKVDPQRGRDGDPGDKRTKLDTIRELRRDRREMRAQLAEQERQFKERLAQVEAQIKAQEKRKTQDTTDEDELTNLLTKPKEYFTKREEILLQRMEERLKQMQSAIPAIEAKKSENVEASKIFKSIPNFDLKKDESELLDLLEDEYGMDEETVFDLAANRPIQLARLVKKAWESKTHLPATVMADKSAAASGGTSSAKPNITTPSLEDLNARLREAMNRGDEKKADAIQAQIEEMLNQNKKVA